MTTPYTDNDLRAEAARQHASLTKDPDLMGVGKQMDGRLIASTVVEPDHEDTGTAWDEIDREDFDKAQHEIHELITGAADVSEWAINLGADGLEPESHTLTVDGDGKPIARLHCAFAPSLDHRARVAFLTGIAQAMARRL
jgi:hypothetical protein